MTIATCLVVKAERWRFLLFFALYKCPQAVIVFNSKGKISSKLFCLQDRKGSSAHGHDTVYTVKMQYLIPLTTLHTVHTPVLKAVLHMLGEIVYEYLQL